MTGQFGNNTEQYLLHMTSEFQHLYNREMLQVDPLAPPCPASPLSEGLLS